jgi:hypothetical protein
VLLVNDVGSQYVLDATSCRSAFMQDVLLLQYRHACSRLDDVAWWFVLLYRQAVRVASGITCMREPPRSSSSYNVSQKSTMNAFVLSPVVCCASLKVVVQVHQQCREGLLAESLVRKQQHQQHCTMEGRLAVASSRGIQSGNARTSNLPSTWRTISRPLL